MKLIPRSPVVVVMGHIDHGKSSLLDYIRQSKVVESEAGGITQAVSAYEIVVKDGKKITFIDTPGHAAFSAMRTRGARLADIALLIISAEDGVKPQTLEALNAILEQKLPYIVVTNKIDKPAANVERVKQQLAENNVLVEGYGGTISSAAISAKTGEGVPELLDLILLQAELESLTTDPTLPAQSVVLETSLDPRTGVRAVVIVKNGTLLLGDYILAGDTMGKVKKLRTFKGEEVKSLAASAPAEITGFEAMPAVGTDCQAYGSKKEVEAALAKSCANKNTIIQPAQNLAKNNEEQIEIPVLIKTDVAGSGEAVEHELLKLENEKVKLKLVDRGVGPINENDIKLVAGGTGEALVLGFNVKIEKSATDMAERLKVKIATFDIIYKLTEWLATEIENRVPKETVATVIGKAKILKIFSQDKSRQVVGGAVLENKLTAGATVKIKRREAEIGQGKIVELQSQKIKTREVAEPNQFGAMIESKITIAAGDTLEAFE